MELSEIHILIKSALEALKTIAQLRKSEASAPRPLKHLTLCPVLEAIEEARLALWEMPYVLNKAAESGITTFEFADAKEKLKRLYILSNTYGCNRLTKAVEDFVSSYYNKWISLINNAIKGKTSIEDVNSFFAKLIEAYDYKVLKLKDSLSDDCDKS